VHEKRLPLTDEDSLARSLDEGNRKQLHIFLGISDSRKVDEVRQSERPPSRNPELSDRYVLISQSRDGILRVHIEQCTASCPPGSLLEMENCRTLSQ